MSTSAVAAVSLTDPRLDLPCIPFSGNPAAEALSDAGLDDLAKRCYRCRREFYFQRCAAGHLTRVTSACGLLWICGDCAVARKRALGGTYRGYLDYIARHPREYPRRASVLEVRIPLLGTSAHKATTRVSRAARKLAGYPENCHHTKGLVQITYVAGVNDAWEIVIRTLILEGRGIAISERAARLAFPEATRIRVESVHVSHLGELAEGRLFSVELPNSLALRIHSRGIFERLRRIRTIGLPDLSGPEVSPHSHPKGEIPVGESEGSTDNSPPRRRRKCRVCHGPIVERTQRCWTGEPEPVLEWRRAYGT